MLEFLDQFDLTLELDRQEGRIYDHGSWGLDRRGRIWHRDPDKPQRMLYSVVSLCEDDPPDYFKLKTTG